MNKDIFEGNWKQVKGKVKEKWGKLTDDDLTRINGKREQLMGSLQTRYGWEKDRAQEEIDSFEKSYDERPRNEKYDREYFRKDIKTDSDRRDDEEFPRRKAK